jgi:hypothetical protein
MMASLNLRTTVHGAAGPQVRHGGTGNAAQVQARMPLEVTVFNGLQASDQQRRHVFEVNQGAVFLLQGIDRRDLGGIQTRQFEFAAAGCVAQAPDHPA